MNKYSTCLASGYSDHALSTFTDNRLAVIKLLYMPLNLKSHKCDTYEVLIIQSRLAALSMQYNAAAPRQLQQHAADLIKSLNRSCFML